MASTAAIAVVNGTDRASAMPPTAERAIFTGALRVGRDHIASTVYTLVLAM
ncbi:hypothetical protein MAHJHV35_48220 [Mycobacterium avium subsp. hominissuis]